MKNLLTAILLFSVSLMYAQTTDKIDITKGWKFKVGDNDAFAKPELYHFIDKFTQ